MSRKPQGFSGEARNARGPGPTVQGIGVHASGEAQTREQEIAELVRRTYGDPRVVGRYTHTGLWPAEKILTSAYVGCGARLLDAGCGAGRTSIPLAGMGLKVTGIDISAAMVAAARRQARLAGVRIDFHTMDVTCMQFPDASFEAALFSYNGFELLPGAAAKRRGLAELHRVLVPGGILVFCTHSLFAVNRHAPARWANLVRVLAGRTLGVRLRAREVGERFIDDPLEEVKYIQILPPSAWLRMLREAQFELLCFNTRRRLERSRPWRWTGVWEDGERFYVARRSAQDESVGGHIR